MKIIDVLQMVKVIEAIIREQVSKDQTTSE